MIRPQGQFVVRESQPTKVCLFFLTFYLGLVVELMNIQVVFLMSLF